MAQSRIAWVVASYGLDVLVYFAKCEPTKANVSVGYNAIDWQVNRQQPIAAKCLHSLGRVVVGDWVRVEQQQSGYLVVEVLPRRNFMQRMGSYHKLKLHCANIDQLLLVLAPLPNTGFYVVDGLLMSCLQQGIQPVLVANKCDVAEFGDWIAAWQDYYHWLHTPILISSAKTEQGIGDLQRQLSAKVSYFMGASGVGKSSLLNALAADDLALTQPLSLSNGQGQHTTTNSFAYQLANSFVIDSPGIKEFLLTDYANFALVFPDVVNLAAHCQFRNCAHDTEKKMRR